nr:hypothetical protein [Devosia sp.]
MKDTLRFQIRMVGSLRCFEPTEIPHAAFDANPRFVAICVSGFADPEQAGAVVPVCVASVLGIDQIRGIAKIGDSVISPNSIDVVNLSLRPIAMHGEPRKAMCLVLHAANRNHHIPMAVYGSCGIAWLDPTRHR